MLVKIHAISVVKSDGEEIGKGISYSSTLQFSAASFDIASLHPIVI
jgi:hypothetical protein